MPRSRAVCLCPKPAARRMTASSATEALTATREALRDAIAREEETERDVAEYVTAEIAAREHALTRLEALAAEYERQIEEEKARHAEEMADLQRAHQKEMSVFAKLVEVSSQVPSYLRIFVSIRASRLTSCFVYRLSGTNARTKR